MAVEDIAPRLQAAVAKHIGAPGTIHKLGKLTGGANKTTWSFEADTGAGRGHFIMQQSSAGSADAPRPLAEVTPRPTAEEDAGVMIAARRIGVPAPNVRAILGESDGLGPAYITDFVEGETLATKILREDIHAGARKAMTAQCGKILAGIHSIDLKAVPFLHPQKPEEIIAAQYKIIDFFNFSHPALELGLKWVERNVPKNPRTTVVHGDFRHGNFIVGPDGIRCVLDWEISLIGDPMQDLGWLCVKTWRFGGPRPVGGFGSREELFAAYEAAGGFKVDPDHVRWWEAFGCVKWAVGCLALGKRGVEEVNVERCAIGRRIEEPLWDFFSLIEGRDN